MRASIIKIGNSNGVIIPSRVLKTLGLTEKSVVSMYFDADGITIKKAPPRAGWAEAAKKMRANEEDALLIPDVFEDEVLEEW
ncbi:MAG: AbrB/MazE/SpoVT family DNA-binding domain-containing protein [Porphyromonas sp.]|nr:AbrB/MazE/SpoVT family DNA-binding domain-containing protein [Porphyromonas sp.]